MTPILRHKNGILSLDNSPLGYNAVAETYLTAETTGGSSTTLTVKNILGFAINQVLLIEELGGENAEIVLTHASTTPSGTTITLTGALVKSHPVGSKVSVLVYNQVEFSNATTATGSKTVLTVATTANFNPPSSLGSGLVAIDPTQKIQSHESSEHTSGFYFARYKNSITSDFSGYSDAVEYGGWDSNTVGYMIENSLREVEAFLSNKLTKNDCYQWITKCLKEIEGKQVRWVDHFSFHQVLGQTIRGSNVITMPTDAYDTETNKSLLAVSIGDGDPLAYVDPIQFEVEMQDAIKTQVTTQATATQTTLEIDNSYDFADSGTVNVYVSGTKYSITYTGVTRSASAGILTGVPASGDGSITVTIPVDTYVWQNEDEGVPRVYTVRNGAIEYYPLADSNEDNQNVYGDYAKVATAIDSDGDTIDYHRFDMVQDYLTWRIWCKSQNRGVLDMNNGYYMKYREVLNDAIRNSPRSIRYKTKPTVNKMLKSPSWKRRVRTSNDT